jgi:carbamoyl-phosphate synthase small subunit
VQREERGYLVLEDGRVFEGGSFGAPREAKGEVVFHTGLTGYQEILTDPSYRGQLVTLTYPHIGNYGVNHEDEESDRIHVEALLVKDLSPVASNRRATGTLSDYLTEQGVPGLAAIDTRALTRHIRTRGAMRAILTTEAASPEKLVERVRREVPEMAGCDLVKKVTCSAPYEFPSERDESFHVVCYDFGIKRGILRSLAALGVRSTVVPAETTAEEVLSRRPHGVLLSNGPGDPEPLDYAIRATRELLGRVPVFGICLGHQVLGLAAGGKTFKLPFGHHGANHPVRRVSDGAVEITSQNHGFAVDPESLRGLAVEKTHENLNDGTLEGLRLKDVPAMSVQYHPEASPGPHDASYLFGKFIEMMEPSARAQRERPVKHASSESRSESRGGGAPRHWKMP